MYLLKASSHRSGFRVATHANESGISFAFNIHLLIRISFHLARVMSFQVSFFLWDFSFTSIPPFQKLASLLLAVLPNDNCTSEVGKPWSVGSVVMYDFHHNPGALLVRCDRLNGDSLLLQRDSFPSCARISTFLTRAQILDPSSSFRTCHELSWSELEVLVVISSSSSGHDLSGSRFTSKLWD